MAEPQETPATIDDRALEEVVRITSELIRIDTTNRGGGDGSRCALVPLRVFAVRVNQNIGVERDHVVVDVGLKTEGRIELKEFAVAGETPSIQIGDTVDVYVERIENAKGEAVVSREKARREEAWIQIEQAFEKGEQVKGHGEAIDCGGDHRWTQ